jgi:ribosome-binding protein aMBF1 (putative translation factor)
MADMADDCSADPSKGIRAAREAADLSREWLAAKAGVSLRTIERIEAGDVAPQRSTLAAIEAVLDRETPEPVPAQEEVA